MNMHNIALVLLSLYRRYGARTMLTAAKEAYHRIRDNAGERAFNKLIYHGYIKFACDRKK